MNLNSGARRERIGWYFYDWANSAFYTSVVTVFLGPYLTSVARNAADSQGLIHPLGASIRAGAFFPYLVSLSVVLQVILLPPMGAIADSSHLKKRMLAFFAYIGAAAAMGLFFVKDGSYLLGGCLFLISNLCYGASIVFYNAFLPEISTPRERDSVSSFGWGIGYLGGGLLLAANLILVYEAGDLGLTTEEAVRISLTSAGAWWAIFTVIPLVTLRNRRPVSRLDAPGGCVVAGFRQLARTVGKVRRYPQTMLFLVAYLLYNDGIQTVITMSTVFGQEELGLPIDALTALVLMVQFVAFLGAVAFNYVAEAVGSKRAIQVSLVIWTGVLAYTYLFLQGKVQFFAVGAVIAVVLGGSQALSRSVYSLMIPKGQEAEYFSLYEISDKGTSWLGPLVFALAYDMSGSYRAAILSLVVFFVVGLAALSAVNVQKAAMEAGDGSMLPTIRNGHLC